MYICLYVTFHPGETICGQMLLDSSNRTGLYMSSPTKGKMELVTGSTWRFFEYDLPVFDWVPDMSAITNDTEM